MVKVNFLRKKRDLKEIISDTITKLRIYISRLELAKYRLRKKEREMFDKVVTAQTSGNTQYATLYANEAAELRKLVKSIESASVSLEQLLLRLETIMELGDAASLLSSLQGLISEVRNVVPQIAPELDNELDILSNAVFEQLGMKYPESLISVPHPDTNDVDIAQILKEAATVAGNVVKEKVLLPEPPMASKEKITDKAQKIAESISIGSQLSRAEKSSSVQNKSINVRTEKLLSLEDKVYLWILEHNGELNVPECAKSLGVTPDDVRKAIDTLSRAGKLKVE